jgi:hypothetical protein
MFKNKAALKEALSDTALGTVLNFPLNLLAMWTVFELQLTVLESSILLWAVFTAVAIVRKYWMRIYFENKSHKKTK